MKKNGVIKSVRISPDLIALIEDQDGKDFTAKLSGILEEYFRGSENREKEIKYYDKLIEKRRKELSSYNDLLMTFSEMRRRVIYLESELSRWQDRLKAQKEEAGS